MPIYEFKCKGCGEGFETLTSAAKVDQVTCPKCDSGEVEKMMSGFAVANSSGGSMDFGGCQDGSCGLPQGGGGGCCSGGTCGMH